MEEYLIELPVCRVCLQASVECLEMDAHMTNEDGDEEPHTYFECFQFCTNLDIKLGDGLPKHICSLCSNELRAAYEFVAKAKNSHDLLIMHMEDIKPEYLQDDAQSNGTSGEVIFLPVEHVNEIFEEETGGYNNVCYDDESCKIDKTYEAESYDLVEDGSQASESGIAENTLDESYENEEKIDESETQETTEIEYKTNKCNLCHKEFDLLDELKDHGISEHGSFPYCCKICFYRYLNKYSLTEHTKRKHDETRVPCDICGTFVKRSFLRAHKRQAHRTIPYLCSACPRTFKTTTGLQIHSETHKENRQRNFECEHCHKKYLTERTYKVHVRTHWHRESFKCKLCDKQFMQKVNLRLHMQMHRGETMDCMYCDKKFVRKTDLKVHMRFHTGNFPYECQYCDKRFAIVSHLNYHQKRHQGIIYKCNVCEKEFMNMSGLRNHSFQHTAMPFNCAVCDKGFPTKFKIKRHLKTVHHVENLDELERCITTEKIKLESKIDETNEEEELLLEEVDEDQSIDV